LNDLRPEVRRAAFDSLLALVKEGTISFPSPGKAVNLHCHTSYSYNGYGYSPTYFAWKARCEGLYVAGIIDFDVLDAVDEFLAASARLGLRACAGIETRVFAKPFATREMNSPGEPGILYHIGVGFVSGNVPDQAFLGKLKDIAQERNRGVLSRVNPFLAPVTLDYDRDVLPLTPKGNATERHLCAAFDNKSHEVFPDRASRLAFWSSKLGVDPAKLDAIVDNAPELQGLIRAKTMKRGGVGYAQPNGPDFPDLDQLSRFMLEAGAIPTFGWLDGTSEGEQAIEELLDVMLASGAAAVNIIPDRNWNIKDPDVKKTKMEKLYSFVELAQSRNLPIVVGTEMNAYGNRFVDDFDAPEMKPLVDVFVDGALIVYAHTVLQAKAGMGYLSAWAKKSFSSIKEKNAFYRWAGEAIEPGEAERLKGIGPAMPVEQVRKAIKALAI